jgi:hypothetical protein
MIFFTDGMKCLPLNSLSCELALEQIIRLYGVKYKRLQKLHKKIFFSYQVISLHAFITVREHYAAVNKTATLKLKCSSALEQIIK